jgi:hypothetical protein
MNGCQLRLLTLIHEELLPDSSLNKDKAAEGTAGISS